MDTPFPTLFLSHGSPMLAVQDSAAGRFLDQLLKKDILPAVPDGLPPELHEMLQSLRDALPDPPPAAG